MPQNTMPSVSKPQKPQNSGKNKHINPSTAQQRSGEHRGPPPNQHNTKQPRNTTQRNNHDNQHTHHQKPARTHRSNRPEQKTLTRCICTQNHRYFLPRVVTPGHITAAEKITENEKICDVSLSKYHKRGSKRT